MELTQEQLDALVAQKVAEAKAGLYTEEDLNKKVTAEVDRRVESGIKKGLETQKQKWEEEFSKKANMTAEELAQKQLEDKLNGLTEKEKTLAKRSNKIEAIEMLADAKVPKSHYDKFIAMLVSDDEEATKANVQNFINVYNSTRTEIETEVKKTLTKVPQPNGTDDGKNGEVTKEKFNKMGYADKMKFKAENPELYKQFMGIK